MSAGSKIKKLKPSELMEGIHGGWFRRHFGAVLIIVILALSYISVRYDCVTAMEQMQALSRRLEVVRTDVQRERSMYMTRTCESSMQQMVDSLGLNLQIQSQPPYKFSLQ